jgi:predicted AAA+ superfamily ATPase
MAVKVDLSPQGRTQMSEKIVLKRIFEPDSEEVRKVAENCTIRNFINYCLHKVLRG